MPRPKRTKVASSAPTLRVADTAPATTHPSQERNLPNQSTRRVPTTSDDSEGIVTTSATLRNRRGVEKRDVFMSGGLGTGDAQDAHRKPGATRRKAATVDTARALEQAKAIEGLKKRREAALAKQKVSVVEVPSSIPASGAEDEGFPGGQSSEVMRREERISPETGFRARETPGAEMSTLALANFKRRPRQPSILQVPVQQGVDAVDDDLYDATDAEEEKKHAADQIVGHLQLENETEFEAQGTPGAEVSILALANFKRRPRQPSILQVAVQQGVSNADDHDLYDDDDDVEQIGAFQPEDESTPFIVSKTKPQIEAILSPSSPSLTPEPPPGSSLKKRKLTPVEVQVPRSSPPEARSSSSTKYQYDENHNSPDLHNDEQEPLSEQPEAHPEREPTPQIWSDTLAPPLSSSPFQPIPHSPYGLEDSVRPATAPAKRKQPSKNKHQSKSNNSPTKPSNLPPTSRTRTRQPLSTATLQTLLPRRRTRARARPSTFDIPSSDSVDVEDEEAEPSVPVTNDDDDDELSHPPGKKPGARKRAANTAPAAAGFRKKASPVKKPRAAATNKKAAAAGAGGRGRERGRGRGAEGPSTKTATKRTYTRRVVSAQDKDKDKENADPDPEASLEGSPDEVDTDDGGGEEGRGGRIRIRIGGPELERAARWFREVEKWELEFEEVTASSSDPMMRDAR